MTSQRDDAAATIVPLRHPARSRTRYDLGGFSVEEELRPQKFASGKRKRSFSTEKIAQVKTVVGYPNLVFRIRRIDPLRFDEGQPANEPHLAQPEQQRDQPSRRRHLILPLSACFSCGDGLRHKPSGQ